jgi:hypothetical protein
LIRLTQFIYLRDTTMMISDSGFSIETLTLPHEDPAEHRRLYNEWITAYPSRDPIERGFVRQAVVAQMEKRRLERVRAALRTDRARTAVLFFEQLQEDEVAESLALFNKSCRSGLRYLLRYGAGVRWAIAFWEKLQTKLTDDGTWYGADRIGAIQLQGVSAAIDELFLSEQAFMTTLDCLVAQPNPKQKDIDRLLDPRCVPKSIQDRDVKLWPGNPAESRARLQALVDSELPRLRALEETLRVQYDDPARAAAEDLALAQVTKAEMSLLRAERMHEQSYAQAVNALLKVRKQAAALRTRPAEPEIDESSIARRPLITTLTTAGPTPTGVDRPVVGRSEHRSVRGGARPRGLRSRQSRE